MKDRIITIMCHVKNQFCNMNRFVLILLLSLFYIVGAYAYSNTQHPSYSMRTVNTSMTTIGTASVGGTSMSKQVTTTQYRVSNNAFSSMPSMNVNTISQSSSKYSQSAYGESNSDSQSGPRNIRGQQRALGEGDENEDDPDKNDPYANPLTDAVPCPLLLAAGYVVFLTRKRSAHAIKRR
jgi:hypothetical protein